MTQAHSSVHVYETHAAAEEAIRALSHAGFDMKQLSLVGKGCHSEEKPMGFYTGSPRFQCNK